MDPKENVKTGKVKLYLAGSADAGVLPTAEDLLLMFRNLTGKEPTEADVADVKRILAGDDK